MYRREVGGETPEFLEVNIPHLGSRFRLDVPNADFLEVQQGYQTISRRYILEQCQESLGAEDWERACDDDDDVKLELCWRKNGNLEWIWLDTDGDGDPRDWSVIWPVGFRQVEYRWSPTIDWVTLVLRTRFAVESAFPTRGPTGTARCDKSHTQ